MRALWTGLLLGLAVGAAASEEVTADSSEEAGQRAEAAGGAEERRQCSCEELEPCVSDEELRRQARVVDCAKECEAEIASGDSPSDVAACFVDRDVDGLRRLRDYRQCLAGEGNLPCSPLRRPDEESMDYAGSGPASHTSATSTAGHLRRRRSLGLLLGLPDDLRRFELCRERCAAKAARADARDAQGDDFRLRRRRKRSMMAGMMQLSDYLMCSGRANCSLAIEDGDGGFRWSLRTRCRLAPAAQDEDQLLCDCLADAGVPDCRPPDWGRLIQNIADAFNANEHVDDYSQMPQDHLPLSDTADGQPKAQPQDH